MYFQIHLTNVSLAPERDIINRRGICPPNTVCFCPKLFWAHSPIKQKVWLCLIMPQLPPPIKEETSTCQNNKHWSTSTFLSVWQFKGGNYSFLVAVRYQLNLSAFFYFFPSWLSLREMILPLCHFIRLPIFPLE